MRTFAEKPKATQQVISPKDTTRTRSDFGHSYNSILHPGRTIGNQAVQRLMGSNTEEYNAVLSSENATHFGHDFSRVSVSPPTVGWVQAKPVVNKSERPPTLLTHPNDSGQIEAPPHVTNVNQVRPATAPSLVQKVLQSPGQPLDTSTQASMESRFGHIFSEATVHENEHHQEPIRLALGAANDFHEQETPGKVRRLTNPAPADPSKPVDFSRVRVHTDARAASSAQAIGALAYTAGNDIVFDSGRYAPRTTEGQRLLAHELAHVVQQGKEIRRYRNTGAFNFGKLNDATLIEDSFNAKKDKETKPWIKQITVEFDSLKTDADGNTYSSGTASVEYYDNPVKLPDFSFTVGGGSQTLGKTDSGTFTVWRIEGIGYNSGAFSGQPGVDFDPTQREGPGKRYSKDLAANMSFAVFYNKGEALHAGPLDFSSHGCVHVDWTDYATIKQLNYHSVIGLTKVKVRYLSNEELEKRRTAEQVERERLRGADEHREGGRGVPAP